MGAADLLRLLAARRTAAVANVREAPPPSAPRKDLIAQIKAGKGVRTVVSEARRIRDLPTWDESALEGLDLTDDFRTPEGTMRLKPRQSLALHFLRRVGGLIGPLAVGSGKTLITLLAAEAIKAHRPVLLIPPAMRVPLDREMQKLRPHWKLPKNLLIVPYSQLSVASSSTLLETVRPDLIIADEAHLLRYPESARTKRLLRFFKHYPETKFVAVSGTLTAKSLRDYGHLCELALHDQSPIPRDVRDLIAWANCIDSRSIARPQDWSVFAEWLDLRDVDDLHERRTIARRRFQARLTSTPGVVATTEASVACSLTIERRPFVAPSDTVSEALKTLRRTWQRPDGEELVTPLDVWRCGLQLSQGFFYRWDWPQGKVDTEWMAARSLWHRAVRDFLKQSLPNLDSPLLVARGVQLGKVTDPVMVEAWKGWDRVRARPKPPTQTVWLDRSILVDVARWRSKHPRGIVWYADAAMAAALREAGERVFIAGETPPYDGEACALSISAHGTGLNLQPWSENLILSWPTSGKVCEQLIGRTHRQGQEADVVEVAWYAHTPETRDAMRKSREDARYIQETTGSPQKICYGTFLAAEDDEPPQGG